ncbi:MAG: cytidylate kinase [Chthonomonadales bacterium]|nr:cytidylate kinase [Chthonomonadales bacterium]
MAVKTVVTISRQLGCGGAEVGRLIAAHLDLHYADSEILQLAAKELGVEEHEISWCDEKPSSPWDRLAAIFNVASPHHSYTPPPLRPIPNEELFELEGKIIRELADREDCVVVGRGAGYFLEEHPCATRILLHAPLSFRIRRVMEIYGAPTPEKAKAMISQSDRDRSQIMARVGKTDWLCCANYHMSIDTGAIPLDKVADLIVNYVGLRSSP